VRDLTAGNDVDAGRDVNAVRDLTAGNDVDAGRDVNAVRDLTAGNDVDAGRDVNAVRDLTAGRNLDVTGDSSVGGTLDVAGLTTLAAGVVVTGPSVFTGTVDITGNTSIGGELQVLVGETTLDVNGTGMNVIVDDGVGNSGRVNMSSTSVSLIQNGNGFTATGGVAQVTGTNSTVISGGTTTMTLNNSGANLSGAGGAPVRLSGVADGVAPTDAVNVRQLGAQMGALESQLSGAIAGTMAMTQIPTIRPGDTYSFGVALGAYNGESAFALGGSAQLDDNITLSGAAQYSDQGGLGAAIGVGWSW